MFHFTTKNDSKKRNFFFIKNEEKRVHVKEIDRNVDGFINNERLKSL